MPHGPASEFFEFVGDRLVDHFIQRCLHYRHGSGIGDPQSIDEFRLDTCLA